jgi:uncharacterized protein
MFLVDTNILVYASADDASEHAKCRALLESARIQATPWYLTWSIIYEFLRVVTHPRVLRQPSSTPAAWEFVEAVLASASVEVLIPTRRHRSVLARSIAEVPHLGGNMIHDAHTAVLMREHGITRIMTRDTDFHRFPWLEVIDPIVA